MNTTPLYASPSGDTASSETVAPPPRRPRPLVAVLIVLLAGLAACQHDEDFEALDSIALATMSELHLPSMVLCAARAEHVLFCRSHGHADVARARRATAHTPYLMASVTKTFTTVATMQLVEHGRLSLDDTVASRLDFPFGHPHAQTVPIRALLTHTSAIEDDSETMYAFYSLGSDPPISLAEAVREYFGPSGRYFDREDNFLDAPPGAVFEYSNMGFALLGRIDEIALGEDFRDVVRDRVLRPLAMHDSTMRLSELDFARVAVPHRWNGTSYDTFPPYTFSDYPDGGLYASAHDVALFAAAVGDERLLEERGILGRTARRAMLTPQLGMLEPGQALGFRLGELDGVSIFGHDGSEWGALTTMWIREHDGMAVVMVANGYPLPEDDTVDITARLDALVAAMFDAATRLDRTTR